MNGFIEQEIIVELGAVVVVPSERENRDHPIRCTASAHDIYSASESSICSPRTPILGNDALQLWIDRVRTLGVSNLWLSSNSGDGQVLRSRFKELTEQGFKRLLLIKLQSYAEMDLSDLVRFHCEKQHPYTDTKDKQGSLGVSLFDQRALTDCGGQVLNCGSADAGTHYHFDGYTKRLLSSEERQDLMLDGLAGACAIQPAGNQIEDGIWVAKDASVDPSARVIGPTFIGSRSLIRAGATIGPFSSIERDCVIDCGTTVTRSSVLPESYLAPGLFINQSVVSGDELEHLRSRARVNLAPARLGRRISARGGFGRKTRHVESLDHILASTSGSSTATAPAWVRLSL